MTAKGMKTASSERGAAASPLTGALASVRPGVQSGARQPASPFALAVVFALALAVALALALAPLPTGVGVGAGTSTGVGVGVGVAFADQEHSKVASSSEMASSKPLLLEGMEPIAGDKVKDGTYDIDAASSSPFFKIDSAKLTVKNGEMTAALSIDSKSYPLIYMGASADAAAAPYDDYIEFDGDAWTFTVPVAALDSEIECAAFSKRRKQWYDRKLMFYAATLPKDALLVDLPEYGDPVETTNAEAAKAATDVALGKTGNENPETGAVPIDLADGTYSIEVNMTGGSGRASVSSPTWLVVEDGYAYARLLWSSSYYDYMIVDEVRYDNLTDDGSNSTFKIPILAMDEEIPVVADTTAMGDPVEIDYFLTFYSSTVDDVDAIPQEAAIKVLMIAIVIIAVGGVLNYVLKKRRKR